MRLAGRVAQGRLYAPLREPLERRDEPRWDAQKVHPAAGREAGGWQEAGPGHRAVTPPRGGEGKGEVGPAAPSPR